MPVLSPLPFPRRWSSPVAWSRRRFSVISAAAAPVAPPALPFLKLALDVGPILHAPGPVLGLKDPLLAAADLAMRDHALEEKLRRRDHPFRPVFGLDAERREPVKEPVNLFEVLECARGRLLVVELDRAAQIEPLLDRLGVGSREV